MSEPAVVPVCFVPFENGIDRCAVQQLTTEPGAGHVVERTHIERIRRCILGGVLTMHRGQRIHQRLHNLKRAANNAAVE